MAIGTQQTQNIRSFITNQLSDTIDWSKHVKVDDKTTGDIGFIEIKTPFNSYKLSMGSAYAEPPHGAPHVCRSLGWVTFDHVGEDKHVLGPKNELTYRDIAKHINERELTDALADGRRKLAEAGGLEVADARMKLREIATKAERHGIKANLPEEPPLIVIQPSPHDGLGAPLAGRQDQVHPYVQQAKALAGGRAPFVGAEIIYYGHDRIAGMDQIPGVLVKIQRDGKAAMFLMADLNEITFMDNVHRRGTDAGNGNVHTTNCWDFNPEWLKGRKEFEDLKADFETFKAFVWDMNNGFCDRFEKLEAKPRRGRPPKDRGEGDEVEGAELASELGPEDAPPNP